MMGEERREDMVHEREPVLGFVSLGGSSGKDLICGFQRSWSGQFESLPISFFFSTFAA